MLGSPGMTGESDIPLGTGSAGLTVDMEDVSDRSFP